MTDQVVIVVDAGSGGARIVALGRNSQCLAKAKRDHDKNGKLFIKGKPYSKFNLPVFGEVKKFVVDEVGNMLEKFGRDTKVVMVATQGVRSLSPEDQESFCDDLSIPGVANLRVLTGEEEAEYCARAVNMAMPGVGGYSLHLGNGSFESAVIGLKGEISRCSTLPCGIKNKESDIEEMLEKIDIQCQGSSPLHASGSVFGDFVDMWCDHLNDTDYPNLEFFSPRPQFQELNLDDIKNLRHYFDGNESKAGQNRVYALDILIGFAERCGTERIILHKTGMREGVAAEAFQKMATTPANNNVPKLTEVLVAAL